MFKMTVVLCKAVYSKHDRRHRRECASLLKSFHWPVSDVLRVSTCYSVLHKRSNLHQACTGVLMSTQFTSCRHWGTVWCVIGWQCAAIVKLVRGWTVSLPASRSDSAFGITDVVVVGKRGTFPDANWIQSEKLAAASGRRRWPICWCCLDRGPGSFNVEDATTLSWSSAAVSECEWAGKAKRYLSVRPNSVASERLFSSAAQVYVNRRSRLLPKRADMLTFLKHNLKLKNYVY